MKRHNSNIIQGTLAAALLGCSALVATPAAARITVIDPAILAQAKNYVTTSQNQLVELNQIKDLEQQQLDAIGQSGSLGSLFSGNAMGNVGSQSDFYENMKKFAFDPCAVNLCQGGSNPVGTTDIEEAREWAMKNFFAGDLIEQPIERDLREIRRRGVVNASVNGVALATITHNELAGAGEQADALDQVVSASQDLRGDIRANSAIALATYKVELQQLAMLTSLLEVQSMESISNTNIYHEEGGSDFADAFIEEDYAVNDRSTRVRVTPPRQGSAGGAGLGGALMQSISPGSGAVSNILSGAGLGGNLPGSIAGLGQSVASGDLPYVSPDNIKMSTVVADAASVAQASLGASAPADLKSSMSMVQSGLASGTAEGKGSAMMGLAQSFASTQGNSTLSAALSTGASALSSAEPQAATAYAQGVLRDISRNGVTGEYADYLRRGIAAVENGTQDPGTLVLDASAILATLGSAPNARASSILQVDPAAVEDTFFRDTLADAMDAISQNTGNADLAQAASDLRRVNDAQVDELRRVMSEVTAAPVASRPRSQESGATNPAVFD